MRHIIGELRRLLITPTAVSGVVVGVDAGVVRVATQGGLVTARLDGRAAVHDRVVVEAGVARVMPAAQESYPV